MSYVKNVELKALFDEHMNTIEHYEYLMHSKIGFAFNRKIITIPDDVPMGGLRCVQYPNEFGKYLKFMFDVNKEKPINTYTEIGVDSGGTFYVTDSFLRSINPNFQRSHAYDIKFKVVEWAQYALTYDVKFFHGDSKIMKPIDVDWCLIDGDHTYEGAKADFEKMKDHARYIAFHDIDIIHSTTNVKKLWEELKPQYEHWEFRNEDVRFPTPVGIGVIKVKD